jgi:hypothetical protein
MFRKHVIIKKHVWKHNEHRIETHRERHIFVEHRIETHWEHSNVKKHHNDEYFDEFITRSFREINLFIFYIIFDLNQMSLLRAHDDIKKNLICIKNFKNDYSMISIVNLMTKRAFVASNRSKSQRRIASSSVE